MKEEPKEDISNAVKLSEEKRDAEMKKAQAVIQKLKKSADQVANAHEKKKEKKVNKVQAKKVAKKETPKKVEKKPVLPKKQEDQKKVNILNTAAAIKLVNKK